MTAVEGTLAVLGLIYDAASDTARWPQALGAIVRHLDARTVALVGVDVEEMRPVFTLQPDVEPGDGGAFLDGWRDDGICAGCALANPASGTRSGHPDAIQRGADGATASPLRPPCGRRHHVSRRLLVRDGVGVHVTVCRAPSKGRLDRDTRAQLECLRPHLTRAAGITLSLARSALWQAISRDLAEQLTVGLVLLDRKMRVRDINPRARDILKAGDALTLRDGTLRAIRPGDDARLQALVSNVLVSCDDAGTEEAELILPRRFGMHPYRLTVSALGGSDSLRLVDLPAIRVLMHDPDALPEIDPRRAACQFGLTPRQAEIVVRVARGEAVSEIGAALRIAPGTVRVHLEGAMKRLGIHRRSQLVALLIGGPRV